MTNDTRSPEEIEREIERERAGLTDTLDNLQDKFSVETIVRQFSDQFREHGGDIGRSVSDAVKSNPVALALTGVGLAWLMLGDKSDPRDRYDRSDRGYDPDDRYVDDRYEGRVGRTGLPSRDPARSAPPQARSLGPQPGDPSKPYYPGEYGSQKDVPSWMDVDQERSSNSNSVDKIRDTASAVGAGVSNTVSSAGDKASAAGKSVSDSAKSTADKVSSVGRSATESAQNLASTAADRAAALRERLAQGTEDMSEEARNRITAARERAVDARNAAARYSRQGREKASDMFEEQPLIAGALALAVGAAIGAALPRSRMEDEYLGAQSDNLLDEAERIFEEEKQKLTKVAKAAIDEGKKVVSEVKENADDAASGETVAQDVVNKAKASGKRIVDAAETEAENQNVGDVKKS